MSDAEEGEDEDSGAGIGGRVEDDYELDDHHQNLLDEFIDFLEKHNETSAENRRSNTRAWIRWCEETGRDINEVDTTDLRAHLDTIYKQVADTSFGARVNSISKFYIWASGRGHLDSNPCEGFSIQDSNYEVNPNASQKYRVLRQEAGDTDGSRAILSISPESVERIAEHPGSPATRNELIIRLFWQTGVRASEMANIKLDDVYRDERRIHIYTSKTTGDDENYTRNVYWQPSLDYLMDEWIDIKRETYSTAATSDYLFLSMHSETIEPNYLSRIVKEAAQRAGENEVMYEDAAGRKRWLVTAHTLRHSFATYCANVTEMPLHILSELLGHRKIDTTLKYVSKDEETIKRYAMERGPE